MRAVVLAILIILLLGGILAAECHGCASAGGPSKIVPDLRFGGNAIVPAVDPVESMLGTVDGLISRR